MLSYIYTKLRGNKTKKVRAPISAEQAFEQKVELNRMRNELTLAGFCDYDNDFREARSSFSTTHSKLK